MAVALCCGKRSALSRAGHQIFARGTGEIGRGSTPSPDAVSAMRHCKPTVVGVRASFGDWISPSTLLTGLPITVLRHHHARSFRQL